MIYPRLSPPHRTVCSLLMLLSLSAAGPCQVAAQQAPPPVPRMGEFLVAATAKKANLRRTSQFLDIDRIDKHLQVALLVDGTDSMQQDMQSLKQNLRAFVRSLENVRRDPVPTVSVALVVYRDTGSPSGAVTPLISAFETRIDEIDAVLQSLEAESGAPYFREAVDQGLHYALSELDWRRPDEPGVSRWIIVAGDAPPYPEQTRFRKHSDHDLIEMAREKQIAIYGMALGHGLVQSESEDSRFDTVTEQERPDLRSFLAKLAQATGGHTVDMLDETSVRYWMTHRQQMPPITHTDIAARRGQREAVGDGPRIAVLPHLPLERMKFDSGRDEVIIATHLLQRLARLGSVEVVAADEVQRACEAVSHTLTLQAIASELNADYVIWGAQKTNFDYLVIESGLYNGQDGIRLAGVSESVRPISDQGRLMILNVIFRRLCESGARELDMLGRMGHAQALRASWNDDTRRRELLAPLAKDHRAQSAILAGLDELERSLASVQSEDAGTQWDPAQQHLDAAVAHLERALAIEDDSPYAYLLLADCYHNMSRSPADKVDPRSAENLEQAQALAEMLLPDDDPVRLEINAQYALLVTRDITTAIGHFRRLAGIGGAAGDTAGRETDARRREAVDARFDLRAHWMLAGIHLGDWDAISWGWDHVDPVQAREHILAILAFWPHSPEAAFYRDCVENSRPESLDVPVGTPQLARTF
jgi:TolB-like protein